MKEPNQEVQRRHARWEEQNVQSPGCEKEHGFLGTISDLALLGRGAVDGWAV